MTPNLDSPATRFAERARQFSTFTVSDLFFGVDVLQVQEVLRGQQMTCVPQAPDVIEGLINLRGQIVTAVDMRKRLGLPLRDGGQAPMNMVVRSSDGTVSLLVDEIGDVLDMDAGAFEQTPENLDPAARKLICGVYKLKDRLLLVLDTESAVEVSSAPVPRNGKSEDKGSQEGGDCMRIDAPVAPSQSKGVQHQQLSKPSNNRNGKPAGNKSNSYVGGATRGGESAVQAPARERASPHSAGQPRVHDLAAKTRRTSEEQALASG